MDEQIIDNNYKIQNHVKSLAFDRSASSTGEIDAINYIEQELKESNIKVNFDIFLWPGFKRMIIKTVYIFLLGMLLINRLVLVVLIFFLIKNISEKLREISFIQEEESMNLFAIITSKNKKEKNPLIIFSAHHDSFSSRLSYKSQKILNLIYQVLIIFYLIFTIFFSIWLFIDLFIHLAITNFFINMLILTFLIGLLLFLPLIPLILSQNKKSMGSIDNASGVAILLELVKYLNKNPLDNTNVLFLWCGAEEWGLKGSKKFCKKYKEFLNRNYDLNQSININIDMVGSYIGLLDKTGLKKKKMNRDLNDIIELSAKKLNIPIIKYNKTIAPKTDYKSFRTLAKKPNNGFQVSCIHSEADSKYIHTAKDTPEKCSNEILNNCLKVCLNTLKNYDSKIQ